jgi:hypothetical protein
MVAAVAVPLIYLWRSQCDRRDRDDAHSAERHCLSTGARPAAIPVAPLYWVFGRIKFDGTSWRYARSTPISMRGWSRRRQIARQRHRRLEDGRMNEPRRTARLQALATIPMTEGNAVSLLVNGKATFDAIFAAIDGATEYVLAQFYIIKDDGAGLKFKDRLIAAARRGVNVYLLYDDVGSHSLPRRYIRELSTPAWSCASSADHGVGSALRLNFRNHRKIVVTDGAHGLWAASTWAMSIMARVQRRLARHESVGEGPSGPRSPVLHPRLVLQQTGSAALRWDAKRGGPTSAPSCSRRVPRTTWSAVALFTHAIESAESRCGLPRLFRA